MRVKYVAQVRGDTLQDNAHTQVLYVTFLDFLFGFLKNKLSDA